MEGCESTYQLEVLLDKSKKRTNSQFYYHNPKVQRYDNGKREPHRYV